VQHYLFFLEPGIRLQLPGCQAGFNFNASEETKIPAVYRISLFQHFVRLHNNVTFEVRWPLVICNEWLCANECLVFV